MADDRYRSYTPPAAPYDRDRQDYGRDHATGRDYGYPGTRDYRGGDYGRDDRNFRHGGTGYGDRDPYGDYRATYGAQDGYGPDVRRFPRGDRGPRHDREAPRGYGRAPQGYDYEDRGFFARAGDEVRSWFGDEDAERRRETDQRYDERFGSQDYARGRDDDYGHWRRRQIEALDRDYSEYRRENATRFENEFGSWRSERQTQRDSLSRVNEHMEVVGSDGEHVGTVDKVRGDRIILTRSDPDAGGRHHSIPSRWIQSVDDKVTVRKTAEQARAHWRDEERSGAMFGDDRAGGYDRDGKVNLDRSFSGTY